jgi:osmotically-inducible protein OsmY
MRTRRLTVLISFLVIPLFLLPPATVSGAEEGSDLWIESQLTTTYALNEHLSSRQIDVAVAEGVVTLSGQVENGVEKALAGEIAKGVDGVEKVRNNLAVGPVSRKEPSRLSGYMDTVNDATITAKVKSNLLWNRTTDGLDIDVDTDEGVVTLTGAVETAAQRDMAVQLARNTSGVREVVDRLAVDPDAPDVTDAIAETVGDAAEKTGQVFNDAWITSKVKTVLAFNKNTDGSDIGVSTENGVVTLEGVVPSERQKRYVVNLVRDIVSVKSVNDRLEVYK